MEIQKRDGSLQRYDADKVRCAIRRSFSSVGTSIMETMLDTLVGEVEQRIAPAAERGDAITVERIQDYVEVALMEHHFYDEVKSFILYRDEHTRLRDERQRIASLFPGTPGLAAALKSVSRDFGGQACPLGQLYAKFCALNRPGMDEAQRLQMLIRAAAELTTQEAPRWEMLASRLLMLQFERQLAASLAAAGQKFSSFCDKIRYLTDEKLYGPYILENYSEEEINEAAGFIDNSRNALFTYSGLDLLLKRYVIRTHSGKPLETPQEMFLGIALHLAMKETRDRLHWVRRFYDMLSRLQATMATPTLSNARKPYHQLSSCFIDTVPDSLDGIYRSIDNFAKVSKLGGGMGLYFGKVRSAGSSIRGFKGVAGGVIRWIRLVNDTAVAVDQLGMRQGAVAVYLDAWHKDLPEFLALRTNNGDDRMKAHDVFPAVCYPDYFWQQVQDNLEGTWHLMCPHEIREVKGYCLEDSFGEEWTRRYLDCVNDPRISKRSMPLKDLVRLIIKSAAETGTPFVFNRDHVNAANPNKHKGIIYCSNLCTEIAQNMSAISYVSQRIETVDGEEVVVTTTRPGSFVVCNLASLSLARIDVESDAAVQEIVSTVVRALDNVIDLNYFPLPYAKSNNLKYRPIGLGVSGYHHMLATRGIAWESDEHLRFVDEVFERINRAAVKASCELAQEKGRYAYFEGSEWQTGEYFERRGYGSAAWQELKAQVAKHGMRNAYLMAIAPTSSTSIIAATTAGLDPIMNRFFLEEKKNGLIPRVAPDLAPENFWFYKNAHLINQMWSVRACGIRQRHVDQAQSMNLYITNEYTFRRVLDLYLEAWRVGVKTVYYVRSKSLEVEECESCAS